jgi:hypothetical protein
MFTPKTHIATYERNSHVSLFIRELLKSINPNQIKKLIKSDIFSNMSDLHINFDWSNLV